VSLIKNLLIHVTGNNVFQAALERNIYWSQYLMGIGSGSDTDTSGETAIVSQLTKKFIPPYCVFDVGAHEGEFANMVLANIGPVKFAIHSFEPSACTFKILAKNIDNNPNVVLNNFGMSNAKGTATLFFDKEGAGAASLTKRRLDHLGIDFEKSEKVQLDTVDDYCATRKIQQIDLLKMDVEGHELDVLRGAEGMFDRKAIRMVSWEFGGCNIDSHTYLQDFFYFFKNFKMQIYRVTPSGFLYPLSKYRESYEQFRTTVFLAVDCGLT